MPAVTVGQENSAGIEIYYEDLPLDKTSQRLPGLIKDTQLIVIEGGPHAIPWTHAGQVNTALLDFIRS